MTNKREVFFKLGNRPLKTATVEVGGESFTVRELSEADAAEMEVKMQVGGKWDFTRHRRLLVSYSLIDDDNKRIVEDSDELKSFPKSLVGKIYEAALEVSHYDESEIEALAKKSSEAEGSK